MKTLEDVLAAALIIAFMVAAFEFAHDAHAGLVALHLAVR